MPESLNDTVLTVVLPDGTPYGGKYELRLGDCTGLDDLDVRKATGFTLWGLIGQVGQEGGLNLVLATAVAWLVRRRDFAHLTYEDIARSVSWGSDFDVVWGGDKSEGDEEGNGEGSESATPKSSEPSPPASTSGPGKSTT